MRAPTGTGLILLQLSVGRHLNRLRSGPRKPSQTLGPGVAVHGPEEQASQEPVDVAPDVVAAAEDVVGPVRDVHDEGPEAPGGLQFVLPAEVHR